MDFYQNYIPDSARLSKISLIISSIIKETTKSEAGSSQIDGFVDLDCLFWISDSGSRVSANWVELGFGFLGAGGSIGGFVDSSFDRLDSDSVFDVFFEAGKKYWIIKGFRDLVSFFPEKTH